VRVLLVVLPARSAGRAGGLREVHRRAGLEGNDAYPAGQVSCPVAKSRVKSVLGYRPPLLRTRQALQKIVRPTPVGKPGKMSRETNSASRQIWKWRYDHGEGRVRHSTRTAKTRASKSREARDRSMRYG
jgi:hypothetical protein